MYMRRVVYVTLIPIFGALYILLSILNTSFGSIEILTVVTMITLFRDVMPCCVIYCFSVSEEYGTSFFRLRWC